MDTNTAGQICAGVKVLAVLTGLVLVWIFPQSRLCPESLEFCEYFQPWRVYIYSLPFILTLIIVLGAISFTMYRAHTFNVEVSLQPMENNISTDSTKAVNQETSQNVEMVENELSLISLENYILNEISQQQQPAPPMLQNFLSPLSSVLDILYKYIRVTVLSLCLLGVNLPEHIMLIIALTTGSGCQTEQFVQAVEYIWVPWTMMAQLLVPYLVKGKMDRFSY